MPNPKEKCCWKCKSMYGNPCRLCQCHAPTKQRDEVYSFSWKGNLYVCTYQDHEGFGPCDFCRIAIVEPYFPQGKVELTDSVEKKSSTEEPHIEGVEDKVVEILSNIVPHTPIKLSETNQTDYDKGYIFYQDMVISNVEEAIVEIQKLLLSQKEEIGKKHAEMIRNAIDGEPYVYHEELKALASKIENENS